MELLLKMNIKYTLLSVMFFTLALFSVESAFGFVEFANMNVLAGIFTGILPVLIVIGLIIFVIKKVLGGLLGENEYIKI
jgi:hypothetical protein